MKVNSIDYTNSSNISSKGVRSIYNNAKSFGYKIYDEHALIKSERNALAYDMGMNIKEGITSFCNNIKNSFINIVK